jgi:hypothetical protein
VKTWKTPIPAFQSDKSEEDGRPNAAFWETFPYVPNDYCVWLKRLPSIKNQHRSGQLSVITTECGSAEGKGSMRMGNRFGSVEIGKRAVVYGYWFRALMNGIPENEMERFMSAQFKFVDAVLDGDEEQIKAADEGIQPWMKFGG